MSPWPTLVTLIALLLYFLTTINVGRGRATYGVPAPQMSGNEKFERILRVQQNMLEQLIFFLPALWIFSIYISPIWGAGVGTAWIVGRALYAWGYYQAADKRAPGFALSSLSALVLLGGGIFGVIKDVLT